jgi:hypothetical protein
MRIERMMNELESSMNSSHDQKYWLIFMLRVFLSIMTIGMLMPCMGRLCSCKAYLSNFSNITNFHDTSQQITVVIVLPRCLAQFRKSSSKLLILSLYYRTPFESFFF